MNAGTLLLSPWRAGGSGNRWTAAGVLGLSVAGALAAATLTGGSHRGVVASVVVAFGEFFMGAMVLAPGLLLAIDARQLRLPGVLRAVLGGVLLNGALAIALPTLVLVLAGVPLLTGACAPFLGLVVGLAFSLLPRYAVVMLGFTPAALDALGFGPRLPSPGQPGFLPCMVTIVAALVLLSLLSARRQYRQADPYRRGTFAPLALQFRNPNRFLAGGWDRRTRGIAHGSRRGGWQDWLVFPMDLRGTGPTNVRRSLRVALGGSFVPLTVGGWARKMVVMGLPPLGVIGLTVLQHVHRQGGHGFDVLSSSDVLGDFLWLGAVAAIITALGAVMHLQQRWRKHNAELPLLALLPGLGERQTLKRALLGACLLPMLRAQCLIALTVVGLDLTVHLHWMVAITLLTQLGVTGAAAACMLLVLGGRPLPAWGVVALAVPAGLLVILSLGLALAGDRDGTVLAGAVQVLAGVWVASFALALWMARCGWRAYAQQTHPFLGQRAQHAR